MADSRPRHDNAPPNPERDPPPHIAAILIGAVVVVAVIAILWFAFAG